MSRSSSSNACYSVAAAVQVNSNVGPYCSKTVVCFTSPVDVVQCSYTSRSYIRGTENSVNTVQVKKILAQDCFKF